MVHVPYFFSVNNVFEITPEEKVHRCDIGASRWSQNKTIPSDPTTREPVESFSYDRVVGPFMFVENTITGDIWTCSNIMFFHKLITLKGKRE
jgi:hypothetical protein